MYEARHLPTIYLFISFILFFAFAYDETNSTFTGTPLAKLHGLSIVVALIGFPLAYGYLRHLSHHEIHKKK